MVRRQPCKDVGRRAAHTAPERGRAELAGMPQGHGRPLAVPQHNMGGDEAMKQWSCSKEASWPQGGVWEV